MSPVGEGDEDVLTAQQTVEVKWSLSGDRERLKQEARQRLEEAGWTDELRQLCREFAARRGSEAVTVAEILQEVRPQGLAKVPDYVKAELLIRIKSTLES